jgi:exonuclease SbcC
MRAFGSRIEEHAAALHAEFPLLKKVFGERDEAFQLSERSRELQSSRDEIQKKRIEIDSQIQSLERKIVRAAGMKEQLEDHRGRMAVAKTLHNALQGDEFIAFIQEEAYARLAAGGSVHLKILSGDRYSFSVDKDEFHVVDHWNADEPRPVATLSGGESFLASLALALALAEGLSGLSSGHTKFALESLFLDEGFGTLDPETLEYVVAGVEGLSSNNRLIGIISHIPELADRMPARIQVEKSVGGSSITVR